MTGAMERSLSNGEEKQSFDIFMMALNPFKFSIGEIQESFARAVNENTRYRSLLRSALPEIMTLMSVDLYSSRWAEDLDTELPKVSRLVHDIAVILGKIPTSYNPPEWRVYPNEYDDDNES